MKLPYATSFTFRRHFKERISPGESLIEAYQESVAAFFQDPDSVCDHALEKPMEDYRAFWITNEYRVVYSIKKNYLLFIDIGTHEQVYRR